MGMCVSVPEELRFSADERRSAERKVQDLKRSYYATKSEKRREEERAADALFERSALEVAEEQKVRHAAVRKHEQDMLNLRQRLNALQKM